METKIYKVKDENDESLSLVGKILKDGGLVAIPTETVYGLAANALDEKAAEKIYAAKGRPSDNPLIVHISDISQWAALVEEIPPEAMKLAKAYWPGPMTIILKKSHLVPLATSGGLDTVAVRMPENRIARKIIDMAGVPLAAPSANTSGRPSPTCAKYVYDDMNGKIDAIVDGGECSVGVESTVLTLVTNPPRILRPGAVTCEMLKDVIGEVEIDRAVYDKIAKDEPVASPGMKYKHYAPKTEVVIIKGTFEAYKNYVQASGEKNVGCLCFKEDAEKLSEFKTVVYGKESDPQSQAHRIFDALREVDGMGAQKVFARFPDIDGIGLAVFNRLVRAAAFNIIEV